MAVLRLGFRPVEYGRLFKTEPGITSRWTWATPIIAKPFLNGEVPEDLSVLPASTPRN